MDRRQLIKTMLAGGAVALAADMAVSKGMADDIISDLKQDMREEKQMMLASDLYSDLERDSKRQIYAMPQSCLTDQKMIWYSVANVAEVWADQLKAQMDDMGFNSPGDYKKLTRMCKQMAYKIDEDFRTAEVDQAKKVLVEVPNLRKSGRLGASFEIVAGLESKANILGQRYRVGYIQEKIYAPVEDAKRALARNDVPSEPLQVIEPTPIEGRSFRDAFMQGFKDA